MIRRAPQLVQIAKNLNPAILNNAYAPSSMGVKPSQNFNSCFTYKNIAHFSTNPHQNLNTGKPLTEKELHEQASLNKPKAAEQPSFESSNLSGLNLQQFVDFLNNKDQKHSNSYAYQSKTLYALSQGLKNKPQIGKITFDNAFWKTVYLFETIIWAPISYVVYSYISPLASLLPLACFVGTVYATRSSQSVMESSIMRMDLINNEQIMLYPWKTQGHGILCKVDGAQLVSAKMPKKDPKKVAVEEDAEHSETVSLEATFIEDTPKGKKVKAIFLVSKEASPIENIDLFKHVVHGNSGEIKKFEYNEMAQKQNKTEEKAPTS